MTARSLWALLAALAVGCGPSDAPPTDGELDSGGQAAEGGFLPVPHVELPFDPNAVAVGDTVDGMRLAASDFRLTPDSVWVGEATFEGPVEVRGVYASLYECADPDGDPDAFENAGCDVPCLYSASRGGDGKPSQSLPRTAADDRDSWLCFTNADDAVAALGPPRPRRAAAGLDGTPVCATIQRYRYVYGHSDVVNEAEFAGGRAEPCDHEGPGPPPQSP